jgi:hypothetical protein
MRAEPYSSVADEAPGKQFGRDLGRHRAAGGDDQHALCRALPHEHDAVVVHAASASRRRQRRVSAAQPDEIAVERDPGGDIGFADAVPGDRRAAHLSVDRLESELVAGVDDGDAGSVIDRPTATGIAPGEA